MVVARLPYIPTPAAAIDLGLTVGRCLRYSMAGTTFSPHDRSRVYNSRV